MVLNIGKKWLVMIFIALLLLCAVPAYAACPVGDLMQKLSKDPEYLVSLGKINKADSEFASSILLATKNNALGTTPKMVKDTMQAITDGFERYNKNGYAVTINELMKKNVNGLVSSIKDISAGTAKSELYYAELKRAAFLSTEGKKVIGVGITNPDGVKGLRASILYKENGKEIAEVVADSSDASRKSASRLSEWVQAIPGKRAGRVYIVEDLGDDFINKLSDEGIEVIGAGFRAGIDFPFCFKNMEQFKKFSSAVNKEVERLGIRGSETMLHGSSVRIFYPSDIDIAVLVDDTEFNRLAKEILSNTRKGTNLYDSVMKDIEKGRLSKFTLAKLNGGSNPTVSKSIVDNIEPVAGNKVQLSVIKRGTSFDSGPFFKLIGDAVDDHFASAVKNSIVGTSYMKILPTQQEIYLKGRYSSNGDYLKGVEDYYNDILSGKPIEPVSLEYIDGNAYIRDGHHRFVAQLMAGVSVDEIQYKAYKDTVYDPARHSMTSWAKTYFKGQEAISSAAKAAPLSSVEIGKIVKNLVGELEPADQNTMRKVFEGYDADTAKRLAEKMDGVNPSSFQIMLNTFRWADDDNLEILRYTLKNLFSEETEKIADKILDEYDHLGMLQSKGFVGTPFMWGASDGKYLFRGVPRYEIPGKDPRAIMDGGMWSRGNNVDKIGHIDSTAKGSFFIPSSKSPSEAVGFAKGDGYMFIIKNDGTAENAAKTIGDNYEKLGGYESEFEMFFHGKVSYENIIGYVEIKGDKMLKGEWK